MYSYHPNVGAMLFCFFAFLVALFVILYYGAVLATEVFASTPRLVKAFVVITGMTLAVQYGIGYIWDKYC